MNPRRVRSLALIVFFLVWVPSGASAQGITSSRRFEFTYTTILKDLPATAGRVRVWIPVASSNAHQTVRILKIITPVPARITRDPSFGNRILYAELHHPRSSTAKLTIIYAVTRYGYSLGSYADLRRFGEDPGSVPVSLVRFLQPDRLVPTNGIIAHIARDTTHPEAGEVDNAYALYNYVFHHMRYDKSGVGWGRGDAVWACDAKHGNCTDFHSLFIALARASGIPARFNIGFPLPAHEAHSTIPGYHCWAEFYVDGLGWVPVDISEAWLSPAKHDFFFGSLDANRAQFSTGRDLILSPKQDGQPLNYFIYPYVEVDGKPYTSIEKKFTFRNLPAGHESSAGHSAAKR